jgi:hypothetical protein
MVLETDMFQTFDSQLSEFYTHIVHLNYILTALVSSNVFAPPFSWNLNSLTTSADHHSTQPMYMFLQNTLRRCHGQHG